MVYIVYISFPAALCNCLDAANAIRLLVFSATMTLAFLLYLLAAFVATIILLAWLLRSGWALRIAMDVPNQRSLHRQPVPRVGGVVALPLALLPAALLLPGMRMAVVAGLLLWGLSFIDDRRGLPVVVRFSVHATAAIGVLLWGATGTPPLLLVLLVVVIIWGTNLFNFMDGADGLAGGMAVVGFVAYVIPASPVNPDLAHLAALLVAVSFGFLLFNYPPAKVFMGDAGSIPLGFFAATLGVFGWQQNTWPLWFPLLVFSPFILDATVTLIKRLLRGERLWLAHRDHYYQRLVRIGWSHRRLALSEYVLMMACSASAIALLKCDQGVQFAGLLAWAVLYALAMIRIDIRWKQQQQGRAA